MKQDDQKSIAEQQSDVIHLQTRNIAATDSASPAMEVSTTQRDQRSAARKSEAQTKALAADYDMDTEDDETLANAPKKKQQPKEVPSKSTNKRYPKDEPAKKMRKNKRKELSYDEYYGRIDQHLAAIERWRKKLGGKSEKLDKVLAEQQGERVETVAKIESLEQQLSRSQKLAEELDEKIIRLQAERVDTLGTGENAALPDNVVKDQLTTLFRESKSWADTWAEVDWNNVKKEDLEQIVEAVQTGRNTIAVSKRTVEAVRKEKISPRILLNAIVNRLINRHTMSHGFQFLRSDSQGVYDPAAIDRIEFLLKVVEKRSLEDYQKCRVALMRSILFAQRLHADESCKDVKAYLDDLMQLHCQHIAELVLREGRSLLKQCNDGADAERKTELLDLVHAFFKKSLELQSQKPRIEVCWRNYLSKFAFELKHQYFIPHRALKLNGDDEETRLAAKKAGFVGREIDFVTEPLILRWGDDDGNNLDQHRIVHQSAVWMVNALDLETDSANEKIESSQPDKPKAEKEDSSQSRGSHMATSPVKQPAKPQTSRPTSTTKLRIAQASQTGVEQALSSSQEQKSQSTKAKKENNNGKVPLAIPGAHGKKRHSEEPTTQAKKPCVIIKSEASQGPDSMNKKPSSRSQETSKAGEKSNSTGQRTCAEAYARRKARKDQGGRASRASTPIKSEWDDPDPAKTPPLNSK